MYTWTFAKTFAKKKQLSPFQKKTLAETVHYIPKGLRKGNPFHGPFAQLSYIYISLSWEGVLGIFWGVTNRGCESHSPRVHHYVLLLQKSAASKPFKQILIDKLVGGFNPSEKYYSSQIGNLPQIGVKMKTIWNHHLVNWCTTTYQLTQDSGHRQYLKTTVLWGIVRSKKHVTYILLIKRWNKHTSCSAQKTERIAKTYSLRAMFKNMNSSLRSTVTPSRVKEPKSWRLMMLIHPLGLFFSISLEHDKLKKSKNKTQVALKRVQEGQRCQLWARHFQTQRFWLLGPLGNFSIVSL